MADSVLFISWGDPVQAVRSGVSRCSTRPSATTAASQQEGRIESFDVTLLAPNGGLDGYFQLHGSADQLSALREDDEFRRILIDATLIVSNMSVADGSTGAGIEREVAMYQEAISKVPQTA